MKYDEVSQMPIRLCISIYIYMLGTISLKFFSDKTDFRISLVIRQSFFSFQNNPKNLDPPYKMDLDFGIV